MSKSAKLAFKKSRAEYTQQFLAFIARDERSLLHNKLLEAGCAITQQGLADYVAAQGDDLSEFHEAWGKDVRYYKYRLGYDNRKSLLDKQEIDDYRQKRDAFEILSPTNKNAMNLHFYGHYALQKSALEHSQAIDTATDDVLRAIGAGDRNKKPHDRKKSKPYSPSKIPVEYRDPKIDLSDLEGIEAKHPALWAFIMRDDGRVYKYISKSYRILNPVNVEFIQAVIKQAPIVETLIAAEYQEYLSSALWQFITREGSKTRTYLSRFEDIPDDFTPAQLKTMLARHVSIDSKRLQRLIESDSTDYRQSFAEQHAEKLLRPFKAVQDSRTAVWQFVFREDGRVAQYISEHGKAINVEDLKAVVKAECKAFRKTTPGKKIHVKVSSQGKITLYVNEPHPLVEPADIDIFTSLVQEPWMSHRLGNEIGRDFYARQVLPVGYSIPMMEAQELLLNKIGLYNLEYINSSVLPPDNEPAEQAAWVITQLERMKRQVSEGPLRDILGKFSLADRTLKARMKAKLEKGEFLIESSKFPTTAEEIRALQQEALAILEKRGVPGLLTFFAQKNGNKDATEYVTNLLKRSVVALSIFVGVESHVDSQVLKNHALDIFAQSGIKGLVAFCDQKAEADRASLFRKKGAVSYIRNLLVNPDSLRYFIGSDNMPKTQQERTALRDEALAALGTGDLNGIGNLFGFFTEKTKEIPEVKAFREGAYNAFKQLGKKGLEAFLEADNANAPAIQSFKADIRNLLGNETKLTKFLQQEKGAHLYHDLYAMYHRNYRQACVNQLAEDREVFLRSLEGHPAAYKVAEDSINGVKIRETSGDYEPTKRIAKPAPVTVWAEHTKKQNIPSPDAEPGKGVRSVADGEEPIRGTRRIPAHYGFGGR